MFQRLIIRRLVFVGVIVLVVITAIFLVGRLDPNISDSESVNQGWSTHEVVSVELDESPNERKTEAPADHQSSVRANTSDTSKGTQFSRTRVLEYLAASSSAAITETYVRQRLSVTDLPSLYDVLEDPAQARHWREVLWAICVLDTDADALDAVTRTIASHWDWRDAGYSSQEAGFVYLELAGSIAALSTVDPDYSEALLKKLFTRQGAREFLVSWHHDELPEITPFESSILNFATAGAGSGLLHSRSSELFEFVENEYHRIAALPRSQRTEDERHTLHSCIQSMAERDIYIELGWDEGFEYVATLTGEDWLGVLISRGEKYYKTLN